MTKKPVAAPEPATVPGRDVLLERLAREHAELQELVLSFPTLGTDMHWADYGRALNAWSDHAKLVVRQQLNIEGAGG